jgi:hypothetical protein
MIAKGRHSHGPRLKEEAVKAIREKAAAGVPWAVLADEYAVTYYTVGRIVYRITWKAVI